jgi:membrane-associated phospholipid phosphatase
LERLILALRKARPTAWLVFLVISLVLFLAWMPAQIRIVIWHGLAARGLLSCILLVFSLLAVSMVWPVGQRLNVWAFTFFNLWGRDPVWLDKARLAFTHNGSGMAALAIGLILFLSGDRLGAYLLILGTLTLWIVVELVKALVRRPRPFIRVTAARIVGYRAGGRSFPSGHTSQAFFTATLMPSHSTQRLGCVFAVCYCPAGGYHSHVCESPLPAGRIGGGHPGQRLGAVGSAG